MSAILRPLLDGGVKDYVRCGQEVIRIEESDEADGGGVLLLCKSGLFVKADVCVITMPIGCLQYAVSVKENSAKGMFDPPLSKKKVEVNTFCACPCACC